MGRFAFLRPRSTGKLQAPGDVGRWIRDIDFLELEISVEHALPSAELPHHHRDAFDRILIARATVEGLKLVSSDLEIAKYDVELLDAAV